MFKNTKNRISKLILAGALAVTALVGGINQAHAQSIDLSSAATTANTDGKTAATAAVAVFAVGTGIAVAVRWFRKVAK